MAKKIFMIKERYSNSVYYVIANSWTYAINKYKKHFKYKMSVTQLKDKQLYVTQLKGLIL